MLDSERKYCLLDVALLAEGVDRNVHTLIHRFVHTVALLAEGVDRNLFPSCDGLNR